MKFSEQFLSAFIIGLIVIAIAVGVILYMQRGAHMDLTGPISIHTVSTDPHNSLAVVNLHLTNPADYGFEVEKVTVTLENDKGEFPRDVISGVDAKRLFDTIPEAGPFHAPLSYHYTIPPHSTGDYTVAAQFSAPEDILKQRKRFVVRIDEINGRFAELREK